MQRSHANTHYGAFQTISGASSKTGSPTKVDATSMRRTNFNLGTDAPTVQTTAGAGYKGPPSNFESPRIADKAKEDLRNSHFTLGAHRSIFTTTSFNSFKDSKGTRASGDNQKEKERRARMRGHNFSIGADARSTNYVTHNASTHKDYSRSVGAHKRSDSASNNIRSSHFQFGVENSPMVSV